MTVIMARGQEWEYSVQDIPYLRLREVLDEMGGECWELVSMTPGDAVELILVFKRPKETEEKE